jgi:hypothetical protein
LFAHYFRSCFDGLPSVFTRVADYLPWIQDTIRDNDDNEADLSVGSSNVREFNVRTDYERGIDWITPRRPPRMFFYL